MSRRSGQISKISLRCCALPIYRNTRPCTYIPHQTRLSKMTAATLHILVKQEYQHNFPPKKKSSTGDCMQYPRPGGAIYCNASSFTGPNDLTQLPLQTVPTVQDWCYTSRTYISQHSVRATAKPPPPFDYCSYTAGYKRCVRLTRRLFLHLL